MTKAALLLAAPLVLMLGPVSVQAQTIYDLTVQTIDGQPKSLADYKGKVLLIVNTASQCGFTPQYKGLEDVYNEFQRNGLEILAFPSNDFNGQEPEGNAEIKKFCELKYKTTFPLFAKIRVRGPQIAPLYQYLTAQDGFGGGITWNFNKFLVDKEGRVVARFDSLVAPESELVKGRIKKLLEGKEIRPSL